MASYQEREETFSLPRVLVGGDGALFLLKVTDDSMASSGITSDDWAIVRMQRTADAGDIVVVMRDGDSALAACTPELSGQSTILGKVTAVLHQF